MNNTLIKAASPATAVSPLHTLTPDDLRKLQDASLKVAIQKDYKNPFDHEDQARTLKLPNGDVRYIIGFRLLDYSELDIPNQVRVDQIDEDDCKHRIVPSIEQEGLDHPIFAEESVNLGKFDVVHGHNRAWSLNHLGMLIPTFILSRVQSATGGIASPLSDLLSRVQPNQVMVNRQYTMDDAHLTIKEAFKTDPTFHGKNPSRKIPPRHAAKGVFDWDDLMDFIFKPTGFFLHKSSRTKIRNLFIKGFGGNKIIETKSDKSITEFLENNKWDTGITTKSKKRKKTIDHFDTKLKSIIIITDSNGENISTKFGAILKAYALDSEWRKSLIKYQIDKINICARIYKPSTNLPDLDKERREMLATVRAWNTVLQRYRVPLRVSSLKMPKQLEDGQDRDHEWEISA